METRINQNINNMEDFEFELMAEDFADTYNYFGSDLDPRVALSMLSNWKINKREMYELMGNNLRLSIPFECNLDNLHKEDHELGTQIVNNLIGAKLEANREVNWIKIRVLENIAFFIRNKDYAPYFKNNKSLPEPMFYEFCEESRGTLEFISRAQDLGVQKAIDKAANMKGRLTRQMATLYKELKKLNFNGEALHVEEYFTQFPHALSEIIQTYQAPIKLELTISIHPFDFFTASLNRDGWRSCYHPEGEYRQSTFCLMTDSNSAIAFLHTPGDYFDKKLRSLVHLSEDRRAVMVNKPYPNESYASMIGFPEAIIRTMAQYNIAPYAKIVSPTYEDYFYHGNYQMFNDADDSRYLRISNGSLDIPTFDVGEKVPCFACGEYHDSGSSVCDECNGDCYSCIECGDRHDESDVIFLPNGDGPICEACYNHLYRQCTNCEYDIYHADALVLNGEIFCPECFEDAVEQHEKIKRRRVFPEL